MWVCGCWSASYHTPLPSQRHPPYPTQERRARDSERIKRAQQRPVTLPQSVSTPSLSVLEAIISLEQDTISAHPLPDPQRQYSQGLEERNNDDWCDSASSSPGISPPSCSFVRWWWDLRKRAQSFASTLIHPHRSEFTLTGGWIILSLSHTLTHAHATWFLTRSAGDLHPAIFPLHTTWSQNWNSIWLHVFTVDCLLRY